MTKTWVLIRFDADTSCNDCCRPLEGIASFTGFEDEKDIVKFIVTDPSCKGIYKSILYGLAWTETSDDDFDDTKEMMDAMKLRAAKMTTDTIVDKILNFLEQSWRNGDINSFILVPKKERLFKMFRNLKGDLWRNCCDEFIKKTPK